ncbi:bifunctional phosphopantothenoylcysteine decarboxylase/phosphopantothenate--cysteine ligase CoaBC [Desertibacillus haloalkaliphilus]|uniref:bifunctional phosphopantothenoylcysteine decarboxylase/phosphopantothenate--cysteine ligase CoaBC n=1 Tax=Desertibacillus haloalkaliphilus TaxID=1328930 RepID=UPI001C265664|nr:bifunctional phosphopantothenoylcysteine decarboxylase/phosphopantothenate--cysteine ligase CoaBC [Desertibacillus haloalkaliphilus]MBU8907065.1 bifunctional phosphopantothenoylcysteine decarboxylase/phosphopantothenate--cysteine ligase CoaBC [Desertibacillus haloalkaliphilus]
MLKDKKILLCVSGGVAVFKAAALTSKLSQAGATVKVMMTDSAQKFVTPLTFQTLSRQPVYVDTFDEKDPRGVAHIDLADWPDLILIAPATANMIGKLANGIADDMISTTLLATTAPVYVAPAMNVHMYEHPAVVKNLKTLASFGYQFIEPGEGYLACGYVGKGRLSEPQEIIRVLEDVISSESVKPLNGKQVLITAGPTQEKVDPVRYFTNHSSGKMGYAVAEAAAKLGADVTLISGPTSLEAPAGVNFINVVSAADMYEAVMERFPTSDVVIKAAAVADYKPKDTYAEKMKKQPGQWYVEMERTTDILATLGKNKQHQLLVGFAAESERVEGYARKKLAMKNLDMIVANDISEEGAGFQANTNIVTLYKRDETKVELPILSKTEVARQLMQEVVALLEGPRHE